tara:strand:- start:2771 stop:3298 length:528 start_codon:yes stop_codon:yes gene_type:complete
MLFKNFYIGLLLFILLETFLVASEADKKKVEAKRSGYWTYYCIDREEQKECKIARKINIEEVNETFLIIYNISGNSSSKVKENLSITTPPVPRIDVKKRLKISFDNKTKFTRSFLECKDDGCLAIFKSYKALKYSLKNFKKIKITFYFSGDEEPTSLTLPLEGFSEALESINQQL